MHSTRVMRKLVWLDNRRALQHVPRAAVEEDAADGILEQHDERRRTQCICAAQGPKWATSLSDDRSLLSLPALWMTFEITHPSALLTTGAPSAAWASHLTSWPRPTRNCSSAHHRRLSPTYSRSSTKFAPSSPLQLTHLHLSLFFSACTALMQPPTLCLLSSMTHSLPSCGTRAWSDHRNPSA